jgi:hypothetical protein
MLYAGNKHIFTGSLSRDSDINLSLSNREGRKVLKEYDRGKEIYAKLK